MKKKLKNLLFSVKPWMVKIKKEGLEVAKFHPCKERSKNATDISNEYNVIVTTYGVNLH